MIHLGGLEKHEQHNLNLAQGKKLKIRTKNNEILNKNQQEELKDLKIFFKSKQNRKPLANLTEKGRKDPNLFN